MRRKLFFLLVLMSMVGHAESVKNISFRSPDGHVQVEVRSTEGVYWKVNYDDETILDWSPIRLKVQWLNDGRICQYGDSGQDVYFTIKYPKATEYKQATYVKRAKVRDEFTQVMGYGMNDGFYAIEWRAYNDGAAYRFLPIGYNYRVINETAEWHFAGDYEAIIPYMNDLRGGATMCFSFESFYDKQRLSEMYADSLAITPLCVTTPSGKRVIIAETGIRNYPGMFVKKGEGNSLQAVHPGVPTDYLIGGYTDLNLVPTGRNNYIAEIQEAEERLPWRVVGIFAKDEAILNSDMMQCLAQADMQASKEARGVYCGQTTWDWWNDWGLTGVDFEPGINNETYHYYAGFAARNGIRYMIVDDGWSDHGDLMKAKGVIDIPALVEDAKKQGVSVILWSSYRALKDNTEATMAYFAKMGVKGFKVDFFDRNDQVISRDVWRLAETAAKYHLLLDLHGYMPTGIQAVYPNVMSFEGVKGLENFKWEQMRGDSTEHDHPRNVVEIPFLRGFVGPYDYTPGSMRNATHEEFKQDGLHSIGTRCNQLALYIIQEAPLQMLADSPTEYEKNPEATEIITQIPTIFDETKVLEARLGEYIVIARRSGMKWYIGAITDKPRTIHIPLSFLSSDKHKATIAEDGPNASVRATDVRYRQTEVTASDTLTIKMAYAGGAVVII